MKDIIISILLNYVMYGIMIYFIRTDITGNLTLKIIFMHQFGSGIKYYIARFVHSTILVSFWPCLLMSEISKSIRKKSVTRSLRFMIIITIMYIITIIRMYR